MGSSTKALKSMLEKGYYLDEDALAMKPETLHIKYFDLERFPGQDRKYYSEKQVQDLVASFQQRIEDGLIPNIEPLHVVPNDKGKFIIHSGERRHQAAAMLEYTGEMLCLVHHMPSDELSDNMFLTNHGRENLSTIDLAEAINIRIEKGIWDKDRAMRMTNIERSKFFALRNLLDAPQPVKELSRYGHRQGINFLSQLAKIQEPALSELCDKIKDGSFVDRDLTIAKRQQESEKQGRDTNTPPKKRRPTKMSLPASGFRRLCEDNGHLRKIVKDACRTEFEHSRLDELNDGDFIHVLSLAIEDYLTAST